MRDARKLAKAALYPCFLEHADSFKIRFPEDYPTQSNNSELIMVPRVPGQPGHIQFLPRQISPYYSSFIHNIQGASTGGVSAFLYAKREALFLIGFDTIRSVRITLD